MEEKNTFSSKRALLVIDAQYDFMPGGALAVTDGDQIIPVINKILQNYELVIFTKDWHDPRMRAFASQHEGANPFDHYINSDGEEDTLWPEHCIAGTRGADLHDKIEFQNCRQSFYIFKKGMDPEYHPYSGFGGTDLDEFLEMKDVDEVDVCGLATDYCVADTALDAAKLGLKVTVLLDACRGIASDLQPTYDKFTANGIEMISIKKHVDLF